MKILNSASKLVFLLIALTACVGFYLGKLESKDFIDYIYTPPSTANSTYDLHLGKMASTEDTDETTRLTSLQY